MNIKIASASPMRVSRGPRNVSPGRRRAGQPGNQSRSESNRRQSPRNGTMTLGAGLQVGDMARSMRGGASPPVSFSRWGVELSHWPHKPDEAGATPAPATRSGGSHRRPGFALHPARRMPFLGVSSLDSAGASAPALFGAGMVGLSRFRPSHSSCIQLRLADRELSTGGIQNHGSFIQGGRLEFSR